MERKGGQSSSLEIETIKKMNNVDSTSRKLSWIAIAFSLIALAVSFSGANEETSIGDTLTVISLLVTVLVGWNILNYMQFKDSMTKIAREEVKSVTEDYKAVLNGLTMLNGKNAILTGNFAYLIDNSFDALRKIVMCKDEELSGFAIDYVMDFIHELSQAKKAKILKGKREEYIYILGNISHKHKASIMRVLEEAEETEPGEIDRTIGKMSEKDIDEQCK